jgi:outer membrane lipoprotein-sorting protein
MKNRIVRCLVPFWVLLLLPMVIPDAVRAQGRNERELVRILEGMDQRWESLPGLTAQLTHTWEWVLAGETQITEGSIYLASGNRFRIETENLTLVSDGKSIWQYSPSQKQVIIDRIDPLKPNASPERPEWVREEREGRARFAVIQLHREETADPRTVEAWVDSERFLVVRLSYTDGAGNRHRYELDGIEIAQQPDDRFEFDIPEGVVVVDMRRPGGGV